MFATVKGAQAGARRLQLSVCTCVRACVPGGGSFIGTLEEKCKDLSPFKFDTYRLRSCSVSTLLADSGYGRRCPSPPEPVLLRPCFFSGTHHSSPVAQSFLSPQVFAFGAAPVTDCWSFLFLGSGSFHFLLHVD